MFINSYDMLSLHNPWTFVNKILIYLCLLFLVVLVSCHDDERSEDFLHCNESIDYCLDYKEGSYCLFGLKWGEDPFFNPGGIDNEGPQSPGGVITYSFLTEPKVISSGLNSELETVAFDEKGACARNQARAALAEWEKYANLSFEEVNDNSASDIKFIAAIGVVEALGNPNYRLSSCHGLSGRVFFSDSQIPCESIYLLCLHEIGHVLGLGHVDALTIMGRGLSHGVNSLQEGDIAGIQAIYGVK